MIVVRIMPDRVAEALTLYAQFLDRGSAPDDAAVELAQRIVTEQAAMTVAEQHRFRLGARVLTLEALQRSRG